MVSLEALVQNYNVVGVGRRLGCEKDLGELEEVMKRLGIPIVAEPRRDQLLRSLEEWRRQELSKEHLGNNRPKPVSEMVAERRCQILATK